MQVDDLGYFITDTSATALAPITDYKLILLQGSASGVVYVSEYLVVDVLSNYTTALLKYDNRTIRVTLNTTDNTITTSDRTAMNVQVFGIK